MSDVERRLRDALAEVNREEAGPGFRALWDRAEAEARERAGKRRLRALVLAPVLCAAAAVAVVFAVLAPGTATDGGPAMRTAGAPEGLGELQIPELSSLPSDDLAGIVVGKGDVDRALLLAWNEKHLGSGTDWLLTLEIPAWDRDAERKKP